MPTPEQEIRRLLPHRMGNSYIRHLIRINIREIRTGKPQQATSAMTFFAN